MLNHPILKKFIETSGSEILYITKSGSQLYGTATPESDTDYKGVFAAPLDKVLLQQDPDHFTYTTGNDTSKNSAEDLDISLDSLHKFRKLISKGETGAIDLLFSIFDPSTTIYIHPGFEALLRANYKKLITSKTHAFVGYCIGQSKRYNVKGARYRELLNWQTHFDAISNQEAKLGEFLPEMTTLAKDYKYITVETKDGSRDGSRKLQYLTLLGKSFSEEVTIAYVKNHIDDTISIFGNRAKAAEANGVDWKGLSHAVRVALEIEELLTTDFIKFPLTSAPFIKAIKAGELDLSEVMDFLDTKLEEITKCAEACTLPETIDSSVLNNYILQFYKD